MAEEPRDCISIDEDVEGDRDGTSDFLFCRIGSAVPLKGSDSGFDLSKPPARPLAISEKFGLLFLAHSAGFLVAKTIDVIGLAKSIKEHEEGNGDKKDMRSLCIQEKCILDSQIGGVHILAVSGDSSVLAAAVDKEIHFFSIPSLINKGQEPILTRSVGKSARIKNFSWEKNVKTSFVVLSTSGYLYHGNLKSDMQNIMEGVEAVDWSKEGSFLAVARNKVLTILSSEFKQQLSISLLFESWKSDTDSNFTIKVDSIMWIRNDSIVVGCVQINENDEEVDYIVQVITTDGHAIPQAFSKPVVVTFSDLFHGIVDDIVPVGGGPNLLMCYMETWNLGIFANKKNTDDHVVLLSWSADSDRKRPVALEFEQEKFIPRIELQENRDENLLLGIDIDRVSIHEKLELKIDSDVKVLSPHCVVLCLSCEGKLIMFHVARISEPDCSSETSFKPHEDIVGLNENSPMVGRVDETTVPSTGLEGKEFKSLEVIQSSLVKEQMLPPPSLPAPGNEIFQQNLKIRQLPVSSPSKYLINSAPGNSIKSGSEINQYSFSGISRSTSSSMGSMLSETSATIHLGKVSSGSIETGAIITHADNISIPLSGSHSIEKRSASPAHSAKSSRLISTRPTGNDSPEPMGFQAPGISQSILTSIQPSTTFSKDSVGLASVSSGSKFLLRPGYNETAPATLIPPASLKEKTMSGKPLTSNFQNAHSSSIVNGSAAMQESETKLSKQFYSVNEMTKELDLLLADIERLGGFRDACTVTHRNLVFSLEEDLKKVSAKLRNCKVKVEEHLQQIQLLQDKRMQVSMRQIYMKGLVTQASDGQYWDIWNSQKLGPEFEVKQQHISKLNHGLVNELVELESHFNALELKNYGDRGAATRGRTALLCSSGSSRQLCSLHTLYNTVNSQLAAAEQLSECLSKQMAVLNINSPPSKRHSVTKELLESIGLDYAIDSFQSPDPKCSAYSPDSSKKSLLLSSSRQAKEHTKRNTLSSLKVFEPESLRRRRDSLVQSWTRFDPPKTVVKRMLQGECIKGGGMKSLSIDTDRAKSESFTASLEQRENLSSSSQPSANKFQFRLEDLNKDDQSKPPKQLSEFQTSSLFTWKNDLSQPPKYVQSFPSSPEMQTSSILTTPIMLSPSLSGDMQDKRQEIGGLDDISKDKQQPTFMRSAFSAETGSLAKARFNGQFDALEGNQTVIGASGSLFSSKSTSPVNTSDILTVKSKEGDSRREPKVSVGQVVTSDHSTSMLEKSPTSLLSTTSEMASQVKILTSRKTQVIGTSSSAAVPSSSVSSLFDRTSVAAAAPVSLLSSKPTPPSESRGPSPTKYFDGSSPVIVSNQTSPPSIFKAASIAPFHSSSTSVQPQVSKTLLPVSPPSKDVPSLSPPVTSQSPIIPLQSKAPKGSGPFELNLKQTDLSPKTEASSGLIVDTLSSSVNPAVISVSSASESVPEISFGSSNSSSTPLKKDEGSVADKSSSFLGSVASVSLSTSHSLHTSSNLPSTLTKEKDEGWDIAANEEDEMEEEAPEANMALSLGALGGFALGSSTAPSPPKTNPFGGTLNINANNSSSASFSLTAPAGELFRPASFSLPSSQPMQTSQPLNSGGFSGFGQPAQIGQQALGSVLGSFGQSRQLGFGAQPSGFTSSVGFGSGGFSTAAMSGGGGFAGAAAGGGFSAVASSSGGFAAMASKPGGFAAAASAGAGFGGSSGSGLSSGGFGSFAAKQGSGGFSQFGSTNTTQTGKAPAELLMQMRK